MRTIEFAGTTLGIELYACRHSEKEYDVFLLNGPWLDDDDLITLADGGDPLGKKDDLLHKGGEVIEGDEDEHRIVKVFQ